MKDIIISVDSTSHKVNFPDEFLGIGYENLQGNLIFQFDNNFIGGQARLDISIDCESGMIPNLTPYENGYILPIKSSLLTGSNVLMQLVIDETSLTQYSLTTDTEINLNKTYYEKVGNDYIIVENPVVGDISQYYEANTPVFKTDIFQLKVKDSINAQETIPEQYPTWINTLNTLIGTINQKLGLVDTALTEMNNLNINVSDKVDGEVTITFTDKQGNQKEVKINDGRGIVSILKTSTSGNIDTYTITYTDDTTSTFEVTNGIDGTDGRGIVSIEKTGTTGLIDTYTITYTDNTTSIFNVANGKGITNIEKISTNLLVDTYRISFNDGTTQDYEVTNGKGIVSIEKTSTEGLTDIYTITYNDETTATFNVVNGKGIVSIEKTSTSGYVDTYTITYNDGTTSTYEVTNGEVSQAQLDALQDELNYYKTIVNALPKITGSGNSITLNNTADSILSNVLNPNIYQETTTGKNLCPNELTNGSSNGITWTINNDGSIQLNGTATARVEPFLYYNDNNPILFKAGSYKNTSNKMIIMVAGGYYALGANSTLAIENDISVTRIYFRIENGESVDETYYPQIILSSVTDETYEQYTGGISAPNTDFPMTIHTISGDNTLKVVWENKLNNYAIVKGRLDNGIIGYESNTTALSVTDNSISFTTNVNYRGIVSDFIPIETSDYIFFAWESATITPICSVSYYDENKNFITSNSGYQLTNALRYPNSVANAKYIRLYISLNTAGTQTINKAQVRFDSNIPTYTPYQEQLAKITLPVENLCDIVLDSSLGNTILFKTYTLKPNTQYTISTNTFLTSSFVANIFAQEGTSLTPNTSVNGINGSKTITSDENGNITIGYRNYQNELDYSSGNYYVQLEPGTKANSYTPFGTTPIEYCVIGNYADIFFKNVISSPLYNATLELDKWYLKKNIAKVVLDGTEAGWTRGDTTDSYSYFYTNGLDSLIGTSYNALCNVFNVLPSSMNASTSVSTDTISIGGTAWAKTRIKILTSRLSENSVNGFKTWLSTHNTEVYYILATPINILLNDTLQSQLEYIYNQMLAYKGQTNISQINNDLPFIMDSTALKDLTSL